MSNSIPALTDSPPALTDLAQRINDHHHAAEAEARSALQHALEAGRLLVEAKSQCQHGTWLPWLKEHFKGSVRNAQGYMRLADNWAAVEGKYAEPAYLTIDGALKLLAGPTKPRRHEGLSKLPAAVSLYLDNEHINEGHAWQLCRLERMYHGLEVDLTEWRTCPPVQSHNDAWHLLHHGMRVEDFPVSLFSKLYEGDDKGIIIEACNTFVDELNAVDFNVPQWHIAAFYWATLAVNAGVSFDDLTTLIANWYERFQSALVHCFITFGLEDWQRSKQGTVEDLEWWLYRSDLRHSGANIWTDPNVVPTALMKAAISRTSSCGMLAPSACQPWGPHHDRWNARYHPDRFPLQRVECAAEVSP